MRNWVLAILSLLLMVSCHSNKQPVPVAIDSSIEENRKTGGELPPQQNNIPDGKANLQPCDTFKVKGGQDQIIAFQLRQDEIDKITDNKERLKVVRMGADFQYYFLMLTKDYSGTGIGINSTLACYINIFDELYPTTNDRIGLIFIRADGTKKIIPGVHTFDEWKDEMSKFFKK